MLEIFVVGDLQTNCYLLYDNNECCLIDVGEYDPIINKFIIDNNLKLKYIISTHGHFDHIGGINDIKKIYPNAVVCGPKNDEIWYSSDYKYNWTNTEVFVDMWYSDNTIFKVGNLNLKTIHIPGHTNGSSAILVNDMLFTGDTLFYQSIGRTDLFFGDFDRIKKSIKKLYKLDPNISVYPGHGRATTIGYEMKYNFFVKA